MHNYLGVLSSDSINRDGYVIVFEALEQMIADSALKGLPSLVDHDFHRPLGWIFPFGLLIEPKITKTIGNFLLCEDSVDMDLVYPKIQQYWQYTNYKDCEKYIDEFKELLREKYLDDSKFIYKGCVAYSSPGITIELFPHLFEKKDKSGLIFLSDILIEFEYIGCGIFKHLKNDYCIFCHQYFKRNLSLVNNYNTYFIDEFIKLNINKDIKLRIAIDENLIGLSKSYSGVLEFDYWWGPKFNNDITSIPDEVTRYENDERHKFFSSVGGTEFWWKTDGNEKTLEIEEIREKASLGVSENSYGCRYIHSIYDNSKGEFIHFDGAIRMYDEEQIMKRWELSINKSGKNTEYTKLFRIDGKLELADWKKLCILYYKGNPLLFEYFGASEEYNSISVSKEKSESSEKYTPNKVVPEDGVRLFVSYHNKSEDYISFSRKIPDTDVIHYQDGKRIDVLEYDVIEICKVLKRQGEELNLPANVNFLKPFDFYTNYPLILHGSNGTSQLLEKTFEAYKLIFELQNKVMNKTIALSVAWEMNDFEVRMSVLGKSSEIVKWLTQMDKIPVDYVEFKKWLVDQKEWIYNNYGYNGQDFFHLLKDDGIFYIKRVPINHEIVSFAEKDNQIYIKIATDNNPELKVLLDDGIIYPSKFGLLKKITCSKTGEDYLTSITSKYMDDDVKMVIEKIEPAGFFWTDEGYY